jgi:small subunit ribosomal protein S6e
MAFKIVVSQGPVTHQVEVEDTKALNGLVIGDEFDGSIVGLDGYKLKITGGSDKNGFTMKKDVSGTRRIKSLLTGGTGYHPKKAKKVKGVRKRIAVDGVKRRKTVRGNTIADDIVQINTVVTEAGSKSIAEILGAGEEEEE